MTSLAKQRDPYRITSCPPPLPLIPLSKVNWLQTPQQSLIFVYRLFWALNFDCSFHFIQQTNQPLIPNTPHPFPLTPLRHAEAITGTTPHTCSPTAIAFRPNWPIRIFRFLHTNLCSVRRPSESAREGVQRGREGEVECWLFFMQQRRRVWCRLFFIFGEFMGFILKPL